MLTDFFMLLLDPDFRLVKIGLAAGYSPPSSASHLPSLRDERLGLAVKDLHRQLLLALVARAFDDGRQVLLDR
jgi:hypothetical protein